jgi:hypothetical protein
VSALTMSDDNGYKPTEQDKKRLRSRNIAVGIVLGLLVVLFYLATWAKFGIGVRGG